MIGRGTDVVIEIAAKYNISKDELISLKKRKRYVKPRQEAIYEMRTKLGYTFPKIGRVLNRDYATCMYHYKRYVKRELRDG